MVAELAGGKGLKHQVISQVKSRRQREINFKVYLQ